MLTSIQHNNTVIKVLILKKLKQIQTNRNLASHVVVQVWKICHESPKLLPRLFAASNDVWQMTLLVPAKLITR